MVPISPEIYSGAAVVMDNRSLFDYIQKIEDRRAKRALAEQEAFDEWNKANEKQIDPTNIRWAKEGDQFTKGLQEYRSLSNDAKRNPKDYTKRIAAQKKADDLIALIRASKEAKENDKEYNTFLRNVQTNPEQRRTTDLEAVLRDKSLNDLPIGFSAPFLGIKRPDDTAPKMNYYKPAPVNTYDIVQKNLGGIGMGSLEKISETGKDFYYTAVPKYKPEEIVAVVERVGKVVSADELLQGSYRVKGQQYEPKGLAQLTFSVRSLKDDSGKPLFPNFEAREDDPISIAVGEAALDMAKRRGDAKQVRDEVAMAKFKSGVRVSEQKAKEKRQEQREAAAQETIGNAFDSIDEIQGVYPDIKISKGKGTIAGIEYTGTVSTKGDKLPELVKAPLRGIGYDIKNNEDVDIKVENGQIVSIKPKDRSAVDREAMRNAQLKFSTEPQKGPQMRFAEKEKEGVKTTSKKTGASSL